MIGQMTIFKMATCCAAGIVLGVSSIAGASEPGFQGGQRFIAPPDAGLVNVLDYGAKPDEPDHDDTAAIQAALDAFPAASRIIYLPNGIYTITDTLRWPRTPEGGRTMKQVNLVGESTDGVILRVPDNHPNFSDPDAPRAVIETGEAPAQRFGNSVRTLTVDVGRDNPGAIGIQFMANNRGILRDVHIVSQDRAGQIGLDLRYTRENGPLMVRNLLVEGFDVGIDTRTQVNSQTFEFIELRGQNTAGLSTVHHPTFVRKLKSINSVPAALNEGGFGLLVLIDSELVGEGDASAKSAVHAGHNAATFLRNVAVSGYEAAVQYRESEGGPLQKVAEGHLEEWVWPRPLALFEDTPARSLNLPVRETPQPPLIEDFSQWANVRDFGATAGTDQDATEAIQMAIDSGARVVYFPNTSDSQDHNYRVDGTLRIRGNVERLTGFEGVISGTGEIRVEDGKADTVFIDNIMRRIGPRGGRIHWTFDTERDVVLSHVGMEGAAVHRGGGALFIEDSPGGPWTFQGGPVWARQFNVEMRPTAEGSDMQQVMRDYRNLPMHEFAARYGNVPTNAIVDGANVWILGMKTEWGGTALHIKNGGAAEALGLMAYSIGAEKTQPLVLIEEGSRFSGSIKEPTFVNLNHFQTKVRETRKGETFDLRENALDVDHAIALFTGYPATANAPAAAQGELNMQPEKPLVRPARVTFGEGDGALSIVNPDAESGTTGGWMGREVGPDRRSRFTVNDDPQHVSQGRYSFHLIDAGDGVAGFQSRGGGGQSGSVDDPINRVQIDMSRRYMVSFDAKVVRGEPRLLLDVFPALGANRSLASGAKSFRDMPSEETESGFRTYHYTVGPAGDENADLQFPQKQGEAHLTLIFLGAAAGAQNSGEMYIDNIRIEPRSN